MSYNQLMNLEHPYGIKNLRLSASVGSNALTVSFSGVAANSPTVISMLNSALNGTVNLRFVTSATSLVVSSGSTLGLGNSQTHYLYVYAIDNSGTIELAISRCQFDEGQVISTTAEGGAGAADSNRVVYSTTARSNVPFRLIGRIKIATGASHATGTTWVNAPSQVIVGVIPVEPVLFKAQSTSTVALGAEATLPVDTVIFDSHNGYTGTPTFTWTTPMDGTYRVNMQYLTGSSDTTASTLIARLQKSTVNFADSTTINPGAAYQYTVQLSSIVVATAGSPIRGRIQVTNSSVVALSGVAIDNYLEIERIGN